MFHKTNHFASSGDLRATMKKVRSVDFSRAHGAVRSQEENLVASNFSRRAARGSYARGLYEFSKDPSSSSCNGAYDDVQIDRKERSQPVQEEESRVIPITVGKLSLIILLLATLIDFFVCHVQQIPLIAERSSFLKQQRPSLGSAAISSVTEALSPILPFTGGLDLRREDYWSNGNWFQSIQSVVTQVSDAFSSTPSDEKASVDSIPRGGGNAPKAKRRTRHDSAISAQQPFVSVDSIADLTLGEVTETFRYAVECNKAGFNEGRFVNSLSPRVRKVVVAMQEAISKSRGKDAKPSIAKDSSFGEIDALAFSAAMRIFAEWRVVRQVPEGYKGYAVGMSLGHKDVVQNLVKIEQGVHTLLDDHRDLLAMQAQWEGNGADENCPIDGSKPRELRSPTLRELLNYEIEMDINPAAKLPRLSEKSAAMGLLWVRRQLAYQTSVFSNALMVPAKFATTADAVTSAYTEVYDRFHGWAVQKIFNYSFQAAPEAEEIYKHMNPRKLSEVFAAAERLGHAVSEVALIEDESEDDNPILGFVKHVGSEWDKLASNVVRVFNPRHEEDELKVRGGSSNTPTSNAEMEAFVRQEMAKDAHEHIHSYLDVVAPVLDDLSVLFDNTNMDDPTKV